MKWNLRWVAAQRDIWRPSQLLIACQQVGFTPSLSKVAALWSTTPVTVRLDDLDKICTALNCTVADLMEAEPRATVDDQPERRAVGHEPTDNTAARPNPRRRPGRPRRSLPPN